MCLNAMMKDKLLYILQRKETGKKKMASKNTWESSLHLCVCHNILQQQ